MADKIQLLPDNIANQIAAGEVVQRPASIVKELLENAIDAGGTDISLHIKDAGKTLIQVSDNGSGMNDTDARMCFERHATSKIRKVDDLFSISTLGFRGEAMASIAAVARVEMKTKTADESMGTQIVIEDSKVQLQEACACNQGTTTLVKNLFFNVPARKNFLKSDKIERKHVIEEFIRVALPNPHIKLQFFEDGKQEYLLPAGNLKQRIVQLFGKRLESALIPVNEKSGIVNITGFVSKPEVAKKMRGEQYFLANNRYIKSPYFNHSIMAAYEGLLLPDHFPLYVLFFEVEAVRLDVNVHPTKTEVKFEEEKAIYSILKTAVRKALSDHHAGPGLSFENEPIVEKGWMGNLNAANRLQNQTNSPFSNSSKPSSSFSPPKKVDQGDWQQLYKILDDNENEKPTAIKAEQQEIAHIEDRAKQPFQIASKYIITSLKSGLVIIHQRKAHQRILYESILDETSDGQCQKLLFPEQLELNVQEMDVFNELESAMLTLGFDFSREADNKIQINGIPSLLKTESPLKTIQSLFELYSNSQFADTLVVKEKLARSLAKASSITEGNQLSVDEMKSLIDQLFACQMPYYHFDGTPVFIRIGTDELDKKFSGQ